ncbi:MAG: hypothetical protein PHF86_01055 [Candidatus Nanoarchaeia archaeon]|nr:hypothetical protein [Candidatus Nanoarchaeia archaeon]
MKKFGILLIIILICIIGFYLFSIGVILFKILIGIGILIIFGLGFLFGYAIGKKIR